ncbi:ribbon-helix-helix protein, CopG family [Candidatus Oleimmundimicrobium sp.]|uniref:CopG family ribbon-helix-helix protein n=1 Tax=Candidatus Oleimmundimicrobium sp. TaxID=3060597 RepID=UPI00271F44A0|nr:ribbon-helix-helix protein, CopG family [Candidatus Oleimmundimicrobium sp.]MDO8886865.1 ribbon-helix-helix protein, CopG family [Candidatus Oleimmundimicrobium sp.]
MMGRTTKVLTFSLPPETAKEIEKLAKDQGKTKSNLLRDAIRVYEEYLAEKEWRELFEFGEETAKRFGIKSEEELFALLNKRS